VRLIDRLRRRYWEGEASGAAVFMSTYGDPNNEAVIPQLAAYNRTAYKDNGIVFGAILARLSLFSEATFAFKDKTDGHLFGADETDGRRQTALRKLEQPWPNGTTGELLARMIQDADYAGNAYIWDAGSQLVRRRPDQVTIVSQETRDAEGRPFREVIGYYWDPAPFNQGQPSAKAQYYTVDEVAHWSPIPDPEAEFKGMSWMTPIVREITADTSLTQYKLRYLEHAATPNLLIKYKQKLLPETIDSLRDLMQARYGGVDNAFKTLILDQGADHSVVGNSLEQMNFTTVQAAGENRILIASGVPGIVVGSKEGLMAATYSNYAQAMRRFADITMRPLWRSACACLSQLVAVPPNAKLWFDESNIAALRQGEKEKADTLLVLAQGMAELTKMGFEPASIVSAFNAGDIAQLKHSGLALEIVTEIPKAAPQPVKLAPPPEAANVATGVNGSAPPVPAGA
jgi:phage portal protein BeeE